ncbi:MAG: FRG domain-containing protein, partial [Paludibacter sp.]
MCKAKSVDEFLKIVYGKIFKGSKEDDPFNVFWFRGENSDYKETSLIPSAYRDIVVKTNTSISEKRFTVVGNEHSYSYLESYLRVDFNRKALPFILSKGIENTAWNRYFLMQHYNVNTRLLDWTEDAIKALFFAIKEDSDSDSDSDDSKVWILRPFELNRFTLNEIFDLEIDMPVIPPLSDDHYMPQELLEDKKIRLQELTRRYLSMDFKKDKKYENKQYYPLAIYPPFLDERIAAQKACFTIFG